MKEKPAYREALKKKWSVRTASGIDHFNIENNWKGSDSASLPNEINPIIFKFSIWQSTLTKLSKNERNEKVSHNS